MKAVNLIPLEQRRGSGAPGRSGGMAYVVLGVLALAVVMVTLSGLSSRSIAHKRARLAETERTVAAAEAKAGSLQPYVKFTTLREQRTQTVRSLAAARFDWATALHELSRALPKDAWLTSLRATVTPSTQVEGGQSDPLRSSLSVPAFEIIGCTTSQANVARVMSALRSMSGVQRVSLSSSEKSATSADAGVSSSANSGATGGGDCRGTNPRSPQFSISVFFAQPAGATSTATASEGSGK